MLRSILTRLFAVGPLLFAVGFFAPVFAAFVGAAGLTLPFGIPPLYAGLGIGLLWGAVAAKRGAWI